MTTSLSLLGGDLATTVRRAIGTFQAPTDGPGKFALCVAIVCAGLAVSPKSRAMVEESLYILAGERHRTRRILVLSFAAAFASLAYVAHYIGGAPKIIDATSYWLQGRAIASGDFTLPIVEPTASFRGRFTLLAPPDHLAGIFPPGYPLLLAGSFILGAPLVLGPLLAAGLTAATYWLGFEVSRANDVARRPSNTALSYFERREVDARADAMGMAAALLSIACVALRYHTADTMAHGATALWITLAWALTLRSVRSSPTGEPAPHALRYAMYAGFAVGMAVATRPVSAVAVFVVAVFTIASTPKPARRVALATRFSLGLVPGVALLAFATLRATGSFFVSPQLAYYAASDGPPGCFRYGFGAGIGCVHEHGDFVRARLQTGFGFFQAAGTTLRRLHHHMADVANIEPLSLLVLTPLLARFRSLRASPAVGASLALVALHIAAYVPFYFDGDYPGGGARFFVDVLPIEHVVIALVLRSLATHVALEAKLLGFLSAALAGFAVHTSHEHAALKARDGGRPMWEPELLEQAHVTNGVVFTDTDHGFAIAHKPNLDPKKGVVVARYRGDDRDRMLLAALGNPPAWRYTFGEVTSSVGSYTPKALLPNEGWRFEAEAEWPPLAQVGGWATPAWEVPACATGGRVLALHMADGASNAAVVITLPVPKTGTFAVLPTVVQSTSGARGSLRLVSKGGRIERRLSASAFDGKAPLAEWTWGPNNGAVDSNACATLAPQTVALEAGEAVLIFSATREGERGPNVAPAGGVGRPPTPNSLRFDAAFDRVELSNP